MGSIRTTTHPQVIQDMQIDDTEIRYFENRRYGMSESIGRETS